jgi:pyrrolidone-carboxylate peptidase
VPDRRLITGFGPFGSFDENPSGLLAERSGRPFERLEVSFEAVDCFLAALSAAPPDRLLLMGVAAGADRFRIETQGRNVVGASKDVLGVVRGPGQIDARGPEAIQASLWPQSVLEPCECCAPSDDAGDYLCNYVFYCSLDRLPGTEVGFLHVPPVTSRTLDWQESCLGQLLKALNWDAH